VTCCLSLSLSFSLFLVFLNLESRIFELNYYDSADDAARPSHALLRLTALVNPVSLRATTASAHASSASAPAPAPS